MPRYLSLLPILVATLACDVRSNVAPAQIPANCAVTEGYYRLARYNGEALPVVTSVSGGATTVLVSERYAFLPSSRYTSSVSQTYTDHGSTVSSESNGEGICSYEDGFTHLFPTFGVRVTHGAFRGDTLVLTRSDGATGVYTRSLTP